MNYLIININILVGFFINNNDNTNNIIESDVEYTNKKDYYLPWNKDIHKYNHFYLESFSINDNYSTIHFHLDNNGGLLGRRK
jgi:hypothetical protein